MESFPVRFGRYELIDLLATGGMAEIFRARVPGQEPSLAKIVAVKRILPSYSKNESFVRLFEKEIGLALGLSHPNLVKLYESGVVKNQYFMAMEYVHGRTLDALVDHCASEHIQIPVEFSCYVTKEICKVLGYAHNLKDKVSGKFVGIIHRDISPQNVIFSYEGQIKLFDFGVAKVMARDSSTVGTFQGKPAYMAPEQARGEDLDNRVDIFSLGVVLWELLTGQRLFFSEQPLLAIKNVTEKPIPPPSSLNKAVPKELDAVVLKALQRPLEARYQSAQQFGSDLEQVLRGLCPGYESTHAAHFLDSAMGAIIERDNTDLHEKMHAEMSAAGPAHGGIDLSQMTSAASSQPEWRRSNAERSLGKKEVTGEISRPKAVRKETLEDYEAHVPTTSRNLWAALALVICAGTVYGGYQVASQFMKTVKEASSDAPKPRVAQAVPAPTPEAVPAPAPAPAPVAAAVAPLPASAPTDAAPTAFDLAAGLPQKSACEGPSRPVCGLAEGAPTTFSTACAADAAHAVRLYSGSCNPAYNPTLQFKGFWPRNADWHSTQHSERAAVLGESLEIDLEARQVPSLLRQQIALVSADGKTARTLNLVGGTAVLALPKDLPVGTYDLEARLLDEKGTTLFAVKARNPFVLTEPSELTTKVIHLPGPAERKPASTGTP